MKLQNEKNQLQEMKWEKNESEFDKQVADNIKFELSKKGLSSVDVCNITGISDSTIRNYISRGDPPSPSFQNIAKIAHLLSIPISNLLNHCITLSNSEKYGELTQEEIVIIEALRGKKPKKMSDEDYEILIASFTTIKMLLAKCK